MNTDRIAVVGAGIVGLSTAYALKERNVDLDLFEPSPPGGAQSAGESRIFRHGHDDLRMVEFSVRSRLLWREWEREFGRPLISDGGALAIGQAGLDRLEAMEDTGGIEVRHLTPGEITDRMPLLAPFEGPAVFDETGGAIHTRLAIASLYQRLAESLIPERVLSVGLTTEGGAEVETVTGLRTYRAVIVCAGTATAGLAERVGLDIPVKVEAQVRSTFRIGEFEGRSDIACLQDSSGEFGEDGAYGGPMTGSRHFALGLSQTTSVSSPQRLDESPDVEGELRELVDRTRKYVQRALPGIDPRPVGHVSCFVTELPWGEDGMAVWAHGPLLFAAGHNLFKQAPALGDALAEAAITSRVPELLQPQSRLGVDKSWDGD